MKKKLNVNTEQPAIEDLKLLSVKICKRAGDTVPALLGTGTIICDGVDFYVLTAAHCFRDKDGNQTCQKEEIDLTLYDGKYKEVKIEVKELELSDKEKDTAIISIKTPPGGYGYYFETLKFLGKELNGEGFVFGYTEKKPYGRLFTYKRVNTNVWANQDGITDKGADFFKTVKGSSGAGMLVSVNDRVYCMGFVRSTFDKVSSLDDVIIQPVNLFKTQWGSGYFPTIEDAIGEPRIESSDNKLQQECINAWRDVYIAISNQENLSDLLQRINAIKKEYSIPKNTTVQNDVMSLLFRRQEPWTEDCQDVFLMALEDQGMWLSIYGDQLPAMTNGIADRPLAKKLEERAVTLTKAPHYDGIPLETDAPKHYYEQMLRYAFAFDFASVKKMAMDWDAKGFWLARKALFVNLFEKNDDVMAALNEYLKNTEDNVLNEKFVATAVYNVIRGDFMDRKSYEPFVKAGLDGISTILTYIADRIDKQQNKVAVYGHHQRYLFGGEDTVSLPEAMRLMRSIMDAGVFTSFRFAYFLSHENWLKVVKHLFTFMPYPILFYTLLYTDEKLLKRVGQEFAYSDDGDVIKALPDIQQRLLSAIGSDDTPKIYIGLYLITSELYIALNEDVWYNQYRDHVLRFFCQEEVLKNVSHNDPIYVNVREGLRNVTDTEHRIEIFSMLISVLPYNSHLISSLIYDYLFVDDDLMSNKEFLTALIDIIRDYPLKDTYMLAGKFCRKDNTNEELMSLINELAKGCDFDFGSETNMAICMLSHVITDVDAKAKMKEVLLKRDLWNCGISTAHYTDPNPVGLEKVDASIGWTVDEGVLIKENMLANLALIENERGKQKGMYKHFGRQYIALLSNMRYFIKNIQKVSGCVVMDIESRIDELLEELRGYKNVAAELSSNDFDTVVDGVWYLRGRYLDDGIENCTNEIQLLINRVMLQVPTALEHCTSLLSAMVCDKPQEMTERFGGSILEVLKRYAEEFEYEALFVCKPQVYKWLKRIASRLSMVYGEDTAVKYWIDDPMVNRFNYNEDE